MSWLMTGKVRILDCLGVERGGKKTAQTGMSCKARQETMRDRVEERV